MNVTCNIKIKRRGTKNKYHKPEVALESQLFKLLHLYRLVPKEKRQLNLLQTRLIGPKAKLYQADNLTKTMCVMQSRKLKSLDDLKAYIENAFAK